SSPGWRALTKPAALAVYERDGRRVVLDQILWDVSLGKEKNRCKRIGTTLLTNLGARREEDLDLGIRTLAFVDLKTQVNRGYVDEEKGDGQGGWTDEGPKLDMRFFPVNLVGTDRNGLGCPKDTFPEFSTMGGCEFKLINPETNDGKSCLVIDAESKHPVSIPVDQTAEALWFLHAADIGRNVSSAPDVAKVSAKYTDGTTADLTLRNRKHLVDWRGDLSPTLGEIAWRGYCIQHDPTVVCTYRWENPHPEKTICHLKITGIQGLYILIGLTLEK
ncbi:MAG: hypothetical protein JXM70_20525, partial [Pirellulales bacterium]|nr:hypothetical protein [Pirellulales bacterium]